MFRMHRLLRNALMPTLLLAVAVPCFGQAAPGDQRQQLQDLVQQLRSGQMDPNQAVQSLIDSGAIPPDTISRLRQSTQDRTLNSLRQQLAIENDDEWAVIAPRIQAVIAASNATSDNSGRGVAGILANLGQAGQAPSAVAQAQTDLRNTIDQGNNGMLVARLEALRNARKQARAALKSAQENLRALMTLRQESVLVLAGYLD